MKKSELKQIIKEELQNMLSEGIHYYDWEDDPEHSQTRIRGVVTNPRKWVGATIKDFKSYPMQGIMIIYTSKGNFWVSKNHRYLLTHKSYK